jgi:hypothetical protein
MDVDASPPFFCKGHFSEENGYWNSLSHQFMAVNSWSPVKLS